MANMNVLLCVLLMCNCCVPTGSETNDDVSQHSNVHCKQWQCKNLPKSTRQKYHYFSHMGCFCDNICHSYKDCCPDADPPTEEQVDEKTLRTIDCVRNCYVSSTSYYKAVVKCPHDYQNNEVADLCRTTNHSDLFLQTPVMGKTTGLTYKNLYCAQCHDETGEFWKPSIHCSALEPLSFTEESLFSTILADDRCELTFQPVKDNWRPCQKDVISTCQGDADDSLRQRCADAGYMLVYANGTIYRNHFCAVCNNQSSSVCEQPRNPSICTSGTWLMGSYSLSILFDINTGRGTMTAGPTVESVITEYKKGTLCSQNELFDPFSQTCRSEFCSRGLGGKCVSHDGMNNTQSILEPSDCQRVILNHSEFYILEDGRLFVLSTNKTHNENDFTRNSSEAHLCINNETSSHQQSSLWTPNFSSVEGTISCVCMALSVLALVITIVVYSLFKQLRNTPGCNMISLSVALCFAELLMLIAPFTEGHPLVCQMSGIGMHYFYLASFAWMNVIAFDTWSTFGNAFSKVGTQTRKLKPFTRYSLYAWIMPAFLVFTAITVQITMATSQFSPKYGQGICWIRNEMALIVFFATPVAVIVIANIGLFTATSVCIMKVQKICPRRTGRDDRGEFLIYIKLFVVMGLTWVLGFLSVFVPHPVTTYLYIIANSLQGLFIGISFVCTRNVFNHFRKRFSSTNSVPTIPSNPPAGVSLKIVHM